MAGKFPNDPGIEFVLGDLDPCVERLGSVTRKYGNAALAKNLAGIDS